MKESLLRRECEFRVLVWFKQVFMELPRDFRKKLLDVGVYSPTVYLFDPIAKSAVKPDPGQLPWPMEFLLTAYHRKHVFTERKDPCLSQVSDALHKWEHKLRWRLHFASIPSCLGDDTSSSRWHNIKVKSKATFPCNARFNSSIESYISDVKSCVFDACRQARSRWTGAVKAACVVPRIVLLGFQQLRESQLEFMPTDKDGGFAVARSDSMQQVCVEYLESPAFREVPFAEYIGEDSCYEYMESCRVVSDHFDDKLLYRNLTSGLRDRSKLFATLKYTCKSHKPQGKVVFRPLHTAPSHPFLAGMRLVSEVVDRKLSTLPHLVKNTDELQKLLNSTAVPSDARLIKLDVKDFYNSGKHENLIKYTVMCADDPVYNGVDNASFRGPFKVLLKTLLDNQFVVSAHAPRRTFKCVQGSGQGIACSGSISDATFYHMVEEPFALRKSIRRKFRVYVYVRFRDDIFLALGGTAETRLAFVNRMRKLSSEFELGMDAFSLQQVEMLDLTIYKGERHRRCQRLDFKIFEKSTSIWVPLSPTSAHAPSVHRMWPVMQARRHAVRASNTVDGRRQRARYVEKLAKHGITVQKEKGKKVRMCEVSSVSVLSVSRMWLIFPFHPAWHNARLSRVIDSIPAPYDVARIGVLGISWRLAGQHLVQRICQRPKPDIALRI